MKIRQLKALTSKHKHILLPFFEGNVDTETIRQRSGIQQVPKFAGKADDIFTLIHPENGKKVSLLGLGKPEKSHTASAHFRNFAFNEKEQFEKDLAVELSHLEQKVAYQAALGLTQATYALGHFKTENKTDHPFLKSTFDLAIIHPGKVRPLLNEGHIAGDCQKRIMELIDLPANVKTPEYLGKHVKASGKKYGFKVAVLNKKQLEKEKLNTLLAVGQGSANPPVLIKMEYKPSGSKSRTPLLGLAGKGITFDTGGISIKSSTNLHYMKSDMGGAAAVIGALELAARLKLNIHLVGIVPAAENSVDAHSLKPGDVVDSYSGKSIEIIDTDAEGRLILADGLAYLHKNYQPKYMIDLATLTGNCVMALGYQACGLFTANDELADTILQAGTETHERAWRLPIWDDYKDDIHSDIADVKNFSGKPINGAIAAAKFLEYFTGEHPNWAHMDIAGVAFGNTTFAKYKSATGFGPRLLVEVMRKLIKLSRK